MKKRKSVKKHFMRRSLERVGVLLDEKTIVNEIQHQKLQFIERQSNRVTIWKYTFMDETYKVVYDKIRKQIVTIIPYDQQFGLIY